MLVRTSEVIARCLLRVDAGAWRDLSASHAQVIARSVRRKPPSLASPVGTGLREEPNHVPKERHDACRHRRNRRGGGPCSSHFAGAWRGRTRGRRTRWGWARGGARGGRARGDRGAWGEGGGPRRGGG